ncbi:MAG: hypothetical protein ACUVXI_13955 [bacterium]
MITRMEYEVLCRRIDRLAEEIKDLQQVVRQLKSSAEEESEKAWRNLMELAEEASASWQGPNAVEEIKVQRDKGLRI